MCRSHHRERRAMSPAMPELESARAELRSLCLRVCERRALVSAITVTEPIGEASHDRVTRFVSRSGAVDPVHFLPAVHVAAAWCRHDERRADRARHSSHPRVHWPTSSTPPS